MLPGFAGVGTAGFSGAGFAGNAAEDETKGSVTGSRPWSNKKPPPGKSFFVLGAFAGCSSGKLKLFAPTVRTVDEICPQKLLAKIKPGEECLVAVWSSVVLLRKKRR